MSISDYLKTKSWLARGFPLPDKLRSFPKILSVEEQRMLAFLGAALAFSAGEIIDLDPFMGGSTSAIGCEVQMNPGTQKTIHSFDMFAVSEQQKRKFLYARGHPIFEGRRILELFKELTAGTRSTRSKGISAKSNGAIQSPSCLWIFQNPGASMTMS